MNMNINEIKKQVKDDFKFYKPLIESNLVGITKFKETEERDHYYSERTISFMRMLADNLIKAADKIESLNK